MPIPLKEYLDFVLNVHPFELLLKNQVALVLNDPEWINGLEKEYLLENSPDTIGPKGSKLVQYSDGEMRLWRRTVWILCNNKHIMLDVVKANMKKQGIPATVYESILSNASLQQIETMYNKITSKL